MWNKWYLQSFNPQNSREQVKKMNALSSHRGPDYSAIYIDQDVVLGHNRLSIIDPDNRSNQPFSSNDGKVVLSFNGEIYNFRELKTELKTTNLSLALILK